MAARELLTSGPPRRAAVIGRPVGHSRSPALHRAAYAALGLDGWRYDAVDVGPDELPALLAGLDATWVGLSVTMPLKQVVMPLLDDVSALAAAVGAVNTVVRTQAGRLHGSNTDVHGIVAALQEAGVVRVERACVLGAGATSASALAALDRLGCPTPVVQVRSPARAGGLLEAAGRLGVRPALVGWGDVGTLGAADVVVSTVPAGAADALAEVVAAPRPTDGRPRVLLDAVYDPWPTPLARAWERAGGRVVDGLAMLLHQAAAQVEAFTGHPAPLAAMRVAVHR